MPGHKTRVEVEVVMVTGGVFMFVTVTTTGAEVAEQPAALYAVTV